MLVGVRNHSQPIRAGASAKVGAVDEDIWLPLCPRLREELERAVLQATDEVDSTAFQPATPSVPSAGFEPFDDRAAMMRVLFSHHVMHEGLHAVTSDQ